MEIKYNGYFLSRSIFELAIAAMGKPEEQGYYVINIHPTWYSEAKAIYDYFKEAINVTINIKHDCDPNEWSICLFGEVDSVCGTHE